MKHAGEYITPTRNGAAFHCPICSVYAEQQWGDVNLQIGKNHYSSSVGDFRQCQCTYCRQSSMWHGKLLIWPQKGTAPHPNPDLPPDILIDYREADAISSMSPRGAAALLRLAIQKLCKVLGEPGKNINTDIQSLVANGLPVKIQQALDVVRVIGNNAVHPGELDLRDDPQSVAVLFGLVNYIAEKMISDPKHVEELYGKLPKEQQAAIQKRDAPKPSGQRAT